MSLIEEPSDHAQGIRLAAALFLFGGVIILVSLLFWIWAWGSPQSVHFGPTAWLVPVLGAAALLAGWAQRRSSALFVRFGGYAAFIACILLFFLFIFGTYATVNLFVIN